MTFFARTCHPDQLEALLQGELSHELEHELTAHLNECDQCRRELELRAAEPSSWSEAKQLLGRPTSDEALSAPMVDESDCQPPRQIQSVLDELAPTDDPQMLGRLGGYEVSGAVGAGGMGIVLKAFDKSLDRTVAIKVLAPHLASSGTARRRFAREAKAAAAVLHPNVIAIHSVSNNEPQPYLVMPYLRGPSLQRRLDEEGPLPIREILRIGSQIAAGLAAAHSQGLVHRDIKPANILLEDGVERVAITDFGLARAVDDATMTRSGVVAGTPQYMSPEQARGEPVDQRSDLFSLGSVMYTMCTGRPPFRAETSYGILRRITDSEPRAIRDVNPDIPEWLSSIIARLMAKRPVDRIDSAGEAAKLLGNWLAHVQDPNGVPKPAALAKSRCRTGALIKRGSLIASTVILILIGVAVFFKFNEADGTSSSETPPPAAAATMATIIKRVEENEQRYQNLETVVRRETHLDPKQWKTTLHVEEIHTIRQDGRLYVNGELTRGLNTGEKITSRYESAFDGDKTTTIRHGNSANVHHGRYEHSRVFPPHTWAMFDLEVNFPLSVLLRGTDALKSHPKVRRFPRERGSTAEFYRIECEYVGSERVGELQCEKIRVLRWYDTRDKPTVWYVWLAPTRNYLCAKAVATVNLKGKEVPYTVATVESFRVVKPDVWIPERVERLQYDYKSLREGKRVANNIRRLVVLRADGNPRHANSRFHVAIPDGIPTYTIKDRRIIDGPAHPTPSKSENTTTLAEIINKVRDNEARYGNLALTIESRYEKDDAINDRFKASGTINLSQSDNRFVLQSRLIKSDGRLYCRTEEEYTKDNGASGSRITLTATDGLWTCDVRQRKEADQKEHEIHAASLRQGGTVAIPLMYPHSMLLTDSLSRRPLSSYLSPDSAEYETKYLGDEIIDGLICHKIQRKRKRKGSAVACVWLAKDRNYLALRVEVTSPTWSETLPTSLATIGDLQEVTSGLWIPRTWTKVSCTRFLAGDGLCENRLIHDWQNDFQITEAEMDPQVDSELFNNVGAPKGTRVVLLDSSGNLLGTLTQKRDGNLTINSDRLKELRATAKVSKEKQRQRAAALDGIIGKSAPRFPTGKWLNAKPLTWLDLSGKVVILNFWAHWCGPCANHVKQLTELHASWAADDRTDTVIIGVHAAGEEPGTQAAVDRRRLGYPVFFDTMPAEDERGWGTLFNRFAVHQIPLTFVIDQQGKVVAHGDLRDMLSKANELVRAGKDTQ